MMVRVLKLGKRRYVMSEKDTTQEKTEKSTVRGTVKKDIELFPVSERRPAIVAHQQAPVGGGMRMGTNISIFNPSTFEEALEIVECLRGRAATTISLDQLKKGDASRLIDFVSGASAALDGDFHKLTDQVYVFCPSNIRIVAPEKETSTKSGAGAFDFLFSSEVISADKAGLGRKS
jgi:cell division inhibitor SepF